MVGSKRRQIVSYIARSLIFVLFLILSINVALNREGFAWMWLLVAVWIGFLVIDGLKTLPKFARMNDDGSMRE